VRIVGINLGDSLISGGAVQLTPFPGWRSILSPESQPLNISMALDGVTLSSGVVSNVNSTSYAEVNCLAGQVNCNDNFPENNGGPLMDSGLETRTSGCKSRNDQEGPSFQVGKGSLSPSLKRFGLSQTSAKFSYGRSIASERNWSAMTDTYWNHLLPRNRMIDVCF
jgi:hypothetical protein